VEETRGGWFALCLVGLKMFRKMLGKCFKSFPWWHFQPPGLKTPEPNNHHKPSQTERKERKKEKKKRAKHLN